MNMTLNGLEQAVKSVVSIRDKVNVVVYADDFIITGISQEILEQKVKPTVITFLKERGLELSTEKSQITHINDGFDFLGFNVRKYNGKLLIKPSKNSVKAILKEIRGIIKSNNMTTESLIRLLNPKIRGWANYYQHVVAKDIFSDIDYRILLTLLQWIKRRHSNKNTTWWMRKYFHYHGSRKWTFFARIHDKSGNVVPLNLFRAGDVEIKRHTKIKGAANPYDPAFADYFERRKSFRTRLSRGCGNRFALERL
jgi:RNA-directed DNA polymerase